MVCRAAAALAGVGLARYKHEGQGETGALFRAVLTATVAAVERRRVGGRAQMMRNHKLKFHSHGRRERTAGKEGDAILDTKERQTLSRIKKPWLDSSMAMRSMCTV